MPQGCVKDSQGNEAIEVTRLKFVLVPEEPSKTDDLIEDSNIEHFSQRQATLVAQTEPTTPALPEDEAVAFKEVELDVPMIPAEEEAQGTAPEPLEDFAARMLFGETEASTQEPEGDASMGLRKQQPRQRVPRRSRKLSLQAFRTRLE